MEARVIGRGLLAGALAGVLAFFYARVFIEPVIGRAVDYESGRGNAQHAQHGMAGGHDHGVELFSRDVQSWAGMGFGVLAFSVAMGALFAVAFVVAYNKIPGVGVRALSLLLAAGAFVTVCLVPFLKYPPSPPSVGEADTLGARTALYLLLVVLSVAIGVGALWLGRRLLPTMGAWNASLTAAGSYVVVVAVVVLLLPRFDETPEPLTDASGMLVYPGFPADDLYHFRLYTLGAQVIIWASIGILFGALVSRLLDSRADHKVTV